MHELNVVPETLAKLLAQPALLVLVLLLLTAAVIDWRTYRIPNSLTVGGTVLGLMFNSLVPQHAGFLMALAGMALGLVLLLPLYMLRAMGAGDVKLMAMVGAFVGFPDIFYAVLFTFVTGGFAALAVAFHRRAFRRMTHNVMDMAQSMAFAALAGGRPTAAMAQGTSIGRLPYGVSIAIGTIGWLAARQLGFA
jgi:prepilin peptidase CpaA